MNRGHASGPRVAIAEPPRGGLVTARRAPRPGCAARRGRSARPPSDRRAGAGSGTPASCRSRAVMHLEQPFVRGADDQRRVQRRRRAQRHVARDRGSSRRRACRGRSRRTARSDRRRARSSARVGVGSTAAASWPRHATVPSGGALIAALVGEPRPAIPGLAARLVVHPLSAPVARRGSGPERQARDERHAPRPHDRPSIRRIVRAPASRSSVVKRSRSAPGAAISTSSQNHVAESRTRCPRRRTRGATGAAAGRRRARRRTPSAPRTARPSRT